MDGVPGNAAGGNGGMLGKDGVEGLSPGNGKSGGKNVDGNEGIVRPGNPGKAEAGANRRRLPPGKAMFVPGNDREMRMNKMMKTWQE